jgi:hypothetical protein
MKFQSLAGISIFTLLFSFSAFSQANVQRNLQERQLLRLSDQVSNLANTHINTLSDRELQELRTSLELSRDILLGRYVPAPTPTPAPRPPVRPTPPRPVEIDYMCTDRDNDNRAPYVLSYVDRDFTVVKLRNVTFATMSACTTALRDKVRLANNDYTCTARDGDNRAPYAVIHLNGTQVRRVEGQVFSSMSSCRRMLTESRVVQGELLFCVDRDVDNRAPYVMRKFNPTTATISPLNSNQFNTMSACQNILFSR